MATGLNFVDLMAPEATPSRTAYVLHGILGSAKNWRTFGRRLTAGHPDWRVVLVDLRNHGDSPAFDSQNTLQSCAEDLESVAAQSGFAPDMVIGHSFGGKVALEWARLNQDSTRVTWVLDTNPAAASEDMGRISSSQVAQVLQALDKVPQPLESREDLVEWLLERGFGRILANWMTTNLRREADGFYWRFHLPGVKELILDYAKMDLLGPLEKGSVAGRIELLRAGRTQWPQLDIVRMAGMSAESKSGFTYHVLPDCGHWVHVEKPQELLALMASSLD